MVWIFQIFFQLKIISSSNFFRIFSVEISTLIKQTKGSSNKFLEILNDILFNPFLSFKFIFLISSNFKFFKLKLFSVKYLVHLYLNYALCK